MVRSAPVAGALTGEAVKAHQGRPTPVAIIVATFPTILARRLDLGDPGTGEDAENREEARSGQAAPARAFAVTFRLHQPDPRSTRVSGLRSEQCRPARLHTGEGEGQQRVDDRQSDDTQREECCDALDFAHGPGEYAMMRR